MGDEGYVDISKARRVTGVGTHGEYLAGERPLYQRLQRQGFNEYGRLTERPYSRYRSCCTRTDALPIDTPMCPYRVTSRFGAMDGFYGGICK